ncbi:MAG: hypothetical protein IJN48_00740 [Clostridia bacterium]|nr:hypothetical protein [Clostridia bacterium]
MSEQNLNDMLSGGGLSSLLQNPEVMAKLPKIMEALGPVMEEMRAEQGASAGEKSNDGTEPSADVEKGDIPAALQLAGNVNKTKNSAASRRRALLRALEPYLSDNRREAMDYIGKVLSLIDILSEVI